MFTLLTITALLIPLPAIWTDGWPSKVLDLSHVPLFALIFIGLRSAWSRPALALIGAWFLAAITEVLQSIVHRSSSLTDFVNGVVGSSLALIWVSNWNVFKGYRGNLVRAFASLALLLVPIGEAVPIFGNAVYSYSSFPVLCDFESRWSAVNWYPHQATFQIKCEGPSHGSIIGRLQFEPGVAPYSGAVFLPVAKDWSGYQFLCIDLRTRGESMCVHVTVRDRRPAPTVRERFNGMYRLTSGEYQIRVGFNELLNASRAVPMDLQHMKSIDIWMVAPKQTRTLDITSIRLE